MSFCLDSDVFPVAKQSCQLSSHMIHQSHTDIFSAIDKPLELFAISFYSLNIQTRLHGSGGSTAPSPALQQVRGSLWRERTINLLPVLSQGINLGVLVHANKAGVSAHPPQVSWGAVDFAGLESHWNHSLHCLPAQPPSLPASSCLLRGQRGHTCALLSSLGTVPARGICPSLSPHWCSHHS